MNEIEVVGNNTLSSEKVILASGALIGENIFNVNTKLMKKNLLSHPYIKDIRIKRKIPNKLIIDVNERVETIVISYLDSFVYLDEEGKVLNILGAKKESIPVVNGIKVESISIGETIGLEGDIEIKYILSLIQACKEKKLVERISEINLSDDNNIILHLKSGTKVAFGDLNNVKYKLSFVFGILTEDLDKKNEMGGIIYLDEGGKAFFEPDSD